MSCASHSRRNSLPRAPSAPSAVAGRACRDCPAQDSAMTDPRPTRRAVTSAPTAQASGLPGPSPLGARVSQAGRARLACAQSWQFGRGSGTAHAHRAPPRSLKGLVTRGAQNSNQVFYSPRAPVMPRAAAGIGPAPGVEGGDALPSNRGRAGSARARAGPRPRPGRARRARGGAHVAPRPPCAARPPSLARSRSPPAARRPPSVLSLVRRLLSRPPSPPSSGHADRRRRRGEAGVGASPECLSPGKFKALCSTSATGRAGPAARL